MNDETRQALNELRDAAQQSAAKVDAAEGRKNRGLQARRELVKLRAKIASMYSHRVAVMDHVRGVFEVDMDDAGNKLAIPTSVIDSYGSRVERVYGQDGVVIHLKLFITADEYRVEAKHDGEEG